VSNSWILRCPQIFLSVQSRKQSLSFIERETGESERYKHESEPHMWIAQPCIIAFHSFDITPWKGWKFWGRERNPLDNTIGTDENNIRHIEKWCFSLYQHGSASVIPEWESLGGSGKTVS
jgi:hypothetical protein